MSTYSKPTESELEVLTILWQKGKATVKEINELLNTFRIVGYTTTLKTIQIMYEKKMLDREENGRNHLYWALISQRDTQTNLVNKMLSSVFNGSPVSLAMHALGGQKVSKNELDELRKLLDNLETDEI